MKNCKYLVLEQQFVPTLFVSEVLFVTVSTIYVIIPGCVQKVVAVYVMKEYGGMSLTHFKPWYWMRVSD